MDGSTRRRKKKEEEGIDLKRSEREVERAHDDDEQQSFLEPENEYQR